MPAENWISVTISNTNILLLLFFENFNSMKPEVVVVESLSIFIDRNIPKFLINQNIEFFK